MKPKEELSMVKQLVILKSLHIAILAQFSLYFSTLNLQLKNLNISVLSEISFGKVMMPLRLALVGALQGPDVFDIIYMIYHQIRRS